MTTRIRPIPLLLILSLALASVAPGMLFATQVRQLNLEQLTRSAGKVFHGRCLEVRVGTDSQLGQTVTYATFVPYRSMKGEVHGKLTLKFLGKQTPDAAPGEATEGIPRFEEGEEVVLFLYPESARGLTSPVGFGQGKFKVVKGKDKKLQAINGFSNERLLDGISPTAQARLGGRLERLHARKDLPLDDLLEMIQTLAH